MAFQEVLSGFRELDDEKQDPIKDLPTEILKKGYSESQRDSPWFILFLEELLQTTGLNKVTYLNLEECRTRNQIIDKQTAL